MRPRRPNSDPTKAGKIPPELIKMVAEEVKEQYKAFLEDKTLIIDGLMYVDEVYLSIGFREKDALRQVNFEASVDFDTESMKALDQIHLAIDAIDSMMAEYVATEGDIELPFDWRAFDYGGVTVFLRHNTENSEIEKLTEEFLKQHPEAVEDQEENSEPETPLH